jgi:hypothetical protein
MITSYKIPSFQFFLASVLFYPSVSLTLLSPYLPQRLFLNTFIIIVFWGERREVKFYPCTRKKQKFWRIRFNVHVCMSAMRRQKSVNWMVSTMSLLNMLLVCLSVKVSVICYHPSFMFHRRHRFSSNYICRKFSCCCCLVVNIGGRPKNFRNC